MERGISNQGCKADMIGRLEKDARLFSKLVLYREGFTVEDIVCDEDGF